MLAGPRAQAFKTIFVFQDPQPAQTQDVPQPSPSGEPKPGEAKPEEQTKPEQQEQTKPEEPPPATSTDSTASPDKTNSVENPSPDSIPAKAAATKKNAPSTIKASPRKRRVKQKPPTPPEGSKVVVKNGSTAEPKIQLSSGGQQQATQQIQSANSLLDATNVNLKKISDKKLDVNQQDMVKQIKDYMEQSKSAALAGDPHGAQTLATKAHLLSEELIKP